MALLRSLCLVVFVMSLAIGGMQAYAGEGPASRPAGPTPYPQNDADWPGRGAIRTFPYMMGIRTRFWSQRQKDQGAVVFVGSSSTENWKDLAKTFPQFKIANRGIGGDTSRGILFRFQQDVLDLHPAAIVMLVGQNDLTAHSAPADALANITAMLDIAQKQDPKMPVVLCTVPPSANPKAPVRADDRQQLNAGIARIAQERENVSLCDVYTAFANPDGSPIREYLGSDVLHLIGPGYERWAQILGADPRRPAPSAAAVRVTFLRGWDVWPERMAYGQFLRERGPARRTGSRCGRSRWPAREAAPGRSSRSP